jgi:uncharacterized protein
MYGVARGRLQMNDTAFAEGLTSSDPSPVSIVDSLPTIRVRPSQFNARTVANDGTLLLFNSYSGAFSGLPPQTRAKAEALLHREGCVTEQTGLAKYMLDRGFLVRDTVNELNKVRALHGSQHYRSDKLGLILLASEECNFRCVYCYEAFSRGTMEPWVRQAVVAMVEQHIQQLRHIDISWFGGEPLLGLDAIRDISPRLQSLALTNGVAYTSQMTTNAFLLTPDVFDELLSYNVRKFQITLDGAPAEHDCKRVLKGGGPSFQTIYDNLLAAQKSSEQFTIRLRVNFDNKNLLHMPDYFELLKQNFANDARFQLAFHPVARWGGANDGQLDLVTATRVYSNEVYLMALATKMGLAVESKLPRLQGITGSQVCYAARPYNLIIGADGTVMKCTIDLDQKERNIVGKLLPNGVFDIDSEKLTRWAEPYFESDEICKMCFYLPACQGSCCPQARFDDGKRPCPREKKNIAATLDALWAQRQPTARQYRVVSAGPEAKIEAGTL